MPVGCPGSNAQFGIDAHHHARTLATALSLVQEISQQDPNGIPVQGSANQVLVAESPKQAAQDLRLGRGDGDPKYSLVIRLVGYVQSKGIRRVDQKKLGYVVPIFQTFGPSDVNPARLSTQILEKFEDVVEAGAVVGQKGVGGMGPTGGSISSTIGKERVVFRRGLIDADSDADMPLIGSIIRTGTPSDSSAQAEGWNIFGFSKENFDFGIAPGQLVPGDIDVEAIDRQVARGALETGSIDDGNETVNRVKKPTVVGLCEC